MSEQSDALKRRAAAFGIAVLRLIRSASRDVACDTVIRQLARSAMSIAANYGAACAGRSRNEFIAKLGIVHEEADETVHWLTTAYEVGCITGPEVDAVIREAKELRAIFASSLGTARRNHKRRK
jgi:four helix bundle protein